MFEEFMGLPAHPLLVHAAVVFLPLQVLAAFVYALVPAARRFIAWLVVALAIVAPAAALFAKLSGEALRDRMIARGTAGEALLPSIEQHNGLGNRAALASAVLAVLMILLVVLVTARSRRAHAIGTTAEPVLAASAPSAASTVLAIVVTLAVLGAGGVTAYYAFKTGDSGASMVWTGL